MVNLREKPFYLDDEGIKWVEDTIASMTLDEKVGQLFVLLKHTFLFYCFFPLGIAFLANYTPQRDGIHLKELLG